MIFLNISLLTYSSSFRLFQSSRIITFVKNKILKKNRRTGYLLLGSNLKNREKSLEIATFLINERVGLVSQKSRIYSTKPWGVEGQADFLNQAIEIKTNRSSDEIIDLCLKIESEMGRVRTGRISARIIDIDFILFEDEIVDTPKLILPHPRMHLRNFVLQPLAELASEEIHPIFKTTISDLFEKCEDTEEVKLFKQIEN